MKKRILFLVIIFFVFSHIQAALAITTREISGCNKVESVICKEFRDSNFNIIMVEIKIITVVIPQNSRRALDRAIEAHKKILKAAKDFFWLTKPFEVEAIDKKTKEVITVDRRISTCLEPIFAIYDYSLDLRFEINQEFQKEKIYYDDIYQYGRTREIGRVKIDKITKNELKKHFLDLEHYIGKNKNLVPVLEVDPY